MTMFLLGQKDALPAEGTAWLVLPDGSTYQVEELKRGITAIPTVQVETGERLGDLKAAAEEVTKLGLKRPFRIHGTFCRIAEVPTSWRFCQIPDEILTQMHIEEALDPESEED